MGGKNKNERRNANKKQTEKKDDKKKKDESSKPNDERLTSEELGFVIRTGPDATHRNVHTLEVDARNIVIHAGKQELLYDAILRCNYGVKYGLVGRNGVGKSTLLRAISDRDGIEVHVHHLELQGALCLFFSHLRETIWSCRKF